MSVPLRDVEQIIDRLADILEDEGRTTAVRREAATHQTSVLSVAIGGADPARVDAALRFLADHEARNPETYYDPFRRERP